MKVVKINLTALYLGKYSPLVTSTLVNNTDFNIAIIIIVYFSISTSPPILPSADCTFLYYHYLLQLSSSKIPYKHI